ncbi:unnamed protein product [Vitrella brassicaformis CCMP3155]|uniref:Mitogen-activated protein kinase n=2 Tax=Vitrella brassicaformis TaxID=1169539 RepID=A0A0G4GVS2_VITBC|nr:unnamed protein product [Vitrella brassicaformis CCMP3155]|eukprot:CEM34961.1 unnamed protein product [Vitrella brassicaformis CCMP3155]
MTEGLTSFYGLVDCSTLPRFTMPAAQPLEKTKKVTVENNGAQVVFEVPERMELIRKVGSGAYGVVVSFKEKTTGQKVAVKKVENAFNDLIDAKRILREIRILGHLKHENFIGIQDMYPPKSPDFEDIYIVTDLMETDLHRVIYSKQELTDEHFQYFIYQLLRGLLYLHSANVLHRDLKPSNILVNKNCDLKICDLGLARGLAESDSAGADAPLTDYVVTRWYRAPEVVLDASNYGRAVDVWAVGCIFCELLGRRALFTGRDHLDQIKQIINILGTPKEEDLQWLPQGGAARRFLTKIPSSKGKRLTEVFPKANPDALDLVSKMLAFDPNKRISVDDALKHKYFEGLHSEEDEPRCDTAIDWSFDNFQPTKPLLQQKVYTECAVFHPDILDRDAAALKEKGWDREARKRLAEAETARKQRSEESSTQ